MYSRLQVSDCDSEREKEAQANCSKCDMLLLATRRKRAKQLLRPTAGRQTHRERERKSAIQASVASKTFRCTRLQRVHFVSLVTCAAATAATTTVSFVFVCVYVSGVCVCTERERASVAAAWKRTTLASCSFFAFCF